MLTHHNFHSLKCRMLASYMIWAVLLLRFEPGASSSQQERLSNMEREIGKLKMKLDKLELENTKLEALYGKFVKAITVSCMPYSWTLIQLNHIFHKLYRKKSHTGQEKITSFPFDFFCYFQIARKKQLKTSVVVESDDGAMALLDSLTLEGKFSAFTSAITGPHRQ